MKKILLLIIVCSSIIVTVKAQAYSPLLENNKYWDVLKHSCWNNPVCCLEGGARYFFNGDSVIHGKIYKKVYIKNFIGSPTYSLFCEPYLIDTVSYQTSFFLREDTLAGNVYYYDAQIFSEYSCVVDSEILLYTFKVQAGDTLKCSLASDGGCNFKSIVDSVRYELISGINRKIIYFSNPEFIYYYYLYFIEGIGTSAGLFQNIFSSEGGSSLECLKKDNNVLYGNNCADYITNIPIQNTVKNEFCFYPNPTYDRISFDKEINGKIVIYNILGDIVFIENIGVKEINISKLSKGVYYIKIAEKEYKIIKL